MRADDREIFRLAVPALGALLAEPAFLVADSAIIGHLGTASLAGLGAAGTVLATAVGLCVFLAYGTTASVSRLIGAGQHRPALEVGIDGCWLALGVGVALVVAGYLTAAELVTGLGATGDAGAQAQTYLRWSLPGVPGMLLVLATVGVLRGMSDTRTPFVVLSVGAVANIAMNYTFVYPLDMGIAGAGLGTTLAQWAMGLAMGALVLRYARRDSATLRPSRAGLRAAGRAGFPLLVRTAALRAVLVLTTYAAGQLGGVQLAGHQVVMTVWTVAAMALDALAIAGQTLTGTALGAGDAARARALSRRMVAYGVGFGVLVGVALLLTHRALPVLFSPDPAVRDAIAVGLLAAAAGQALSGYDFVLDGVLIGAGDGAYLAWAASIVLIAYLPMVFAVLRFGPDGNSGLGWLWAAFSVGFMGVRAATLWWRSRSGRWAVTGATLAAPGVIDAT